MHCASNAFCAYHDFFYNYFGAAIYAAMPYAASFNCNPGSSPNHNDADQTIDLISHEEMEAATDPLLNGWKDSSGSEMGDKCSWNFGPRDPSGGNVVWNTHEYIVQQEWSNQGSTCSLIPYTGMPNLPLSWNQCAGENGVCSFSGSMIVAYGANGRYFYRVFTNGVACNNSVFGDSDPGTVKACYMMDAPPMTNVWVPCASQNGTCHFSGDLEVAYGMNGQFFYQNVSNGTACNDSVFGNPTPDLKMCFYN